MEFKYEIKAHIKSLQDEIEWYRHKETEFVDRLIDFLHENNLSCEDCSIEKCDYHSLGILERCENFKLKEKEVKE